MQTAKQDVRQLLDHLPDDSTIEDIQYHLYVLEKIRRGQEDICDGRRFTQEEMRKQLQLRYAPEPIKSFSQRTD